MSEIVIEAKGLTKRYGAAYAVNGATFDVAAGEIFGLLGPNGAGKTTTILMLLGLCEISSGQAFRELTPAAVRMTITMVVTLPIIFVYPFLQKYFVKGIMMGAIKG